MIHSLKNWFDSLPIHLKVTLVFGVGIFLIMTLQPPHNPYMSQSSDFKNSLLKILYFEKPETPESRLLLMRSMEICRTSVTTGGCRALFSNIAWILQKVQGAPPKCYPSLMAIPKTRERLEKALKLVVHLAWGEEPPRHITQRYGWLDPSEVSTFCELKTMLKNTSTKEVWAKTREQILKSLPSQDPMDVKSRWKLSLFSVPCQSLFR